MNKLIIPLFVLLVSCSIKKKQVNYESETLKIEPLTEHTFQHVSYLETESWGKVACNGMIVVDNGEAIIFDTPINNQVSHELLDWVEKELICKVKAVVATHFHDDCVGGLLTFHQRGTPSYANNKTIELLSNQEGAKPKIGFSDFLELQVGNESIVLDYLGEGHTQDNIIGYFPKEQVLFGGCLLKSMGAGKGNLEDANPMAWPKTVENVKSKYPKATRIIPGHGKSGGRELLDYTIKLFAEN